ncbi:TadE/TadG family type IV pilus assembly protein [Nocardioides bruguierae]|uniref:Pilus assembly protein n=1 Tax=Nocardioides bruguierae TaxID=2945102 RepID=A0A9X2IFE7_9ACTN|nr:TadE/TadG family type IV pilus assembly protein [Nocardioides bruguierae]MCL8026622.1 pilus assembly protein [Nocardioides bruguierae]MCM0619645.1 pilus assembly protein [Nocardioides bruguierae]
MPGRRSPRVAPAPRGAERARGPRRAGARPDRGAAAVEMALVLPVLLLLLFGIITYGMMLSFRQGLTQAAAEGARAAAVTVVASQRQTDAEAAVSSALEPYDVSCAGGVLTRDGEAVGTCTVTEVPCGTVVCAEVALDYHYREHPTFPVLPLMDALVPDSLAFSTQVRVS